MPFCVIFGYSLARTLETLCPPPNSPLRRAKNTAEPGCGEKACGNIPDDTRIEGTKKKSVLRRVFVDLSAREGRLIGWARLAPLALIAFVGRSPRRETPEGTRQALGYCRRPTVREDSSSYHHPSKQRAPAVPSGVTLPHDSSSNLVQPSTSLLAPYPTGARAIRAHVARGYIQCIPEHTNTPPLHRDMETPWRIYRGPHSDDPGGSFPPSLPETPPSPASPSRARFSRPPRWTPCPGPLSSV